MLFVFLPGTDDDTPIWPGHYAVSVFLVIREFASVNATIQPKVLAGAFHLVALPVAFIFVLVFQNVVAITADVVVLELTLVHG